MIDIYNINIGSKVKASRDAWCLKKDKVYIVAEVRASVIFVQSHDDCDHGPPCSKFKCGGWEEDYFDHVVDRQVEEYLPKINDHLCSCSLQIIMSNGCQCGGK